MKYIVNWTFGKKEFFKAFEDSTRAIDFYYKVIEEENPLHIVVGEVLEIESLTK